MLHLHAKPYTQDSAIYGISQSADEMVMQGTRARLL